MLQSVSAYWTQHHQAPRRFKRQSVYAHSVNFEHQGTLLTFHDRSRVPSPMSILLNLSETELAPFFHDIETLVMTSRGIVLQDVCYPFDLTEQTSHQLHVHSPLSSSSLKCLQTQLDTVFASNPPSNTLEAQWFEQRLNHLQHHASEAASLRDALSSLMGFGSGLTPAGDDALVGFLAGLYYTQQDELLTDVKHHLTELLAQPNVTVWLSQHFLHMALDGWFIEPILTLYDHLMKDQSIEAIIHQIHSLGHTSGTDLLRGLALAISTGGNLYGS